MNPPDEAAGFLHLLDPAATAFTFQTIDDNKERDDHNLARVLHGALDQHAATLTRLNDKGAGIYVTVNETDLKGRKANNITRVRAVFVDLDGSPLAPVLENKVKPQSIVETSPGKFHVYWLVDGMPLSDFASVQEAIANRYGGDKVSDLPRVMRLPGFYHRKAEPFLVRITSVNETPPYPASTFERAPASRHTPGDKELATDYDIILAIEALEVIPPMTKWADRNYIGMATWRATDGHPEGFEAWCKWLQRSGKYSERAAEKQWRRYFGSPPNELTLGTLIFLANLIDPEWRNKLEATLLSWVKS